MKNKILALSLLLLLATLLIVSVSPPAKAAGEGQWITAYTIEDASTGEPLVEYNAATGVNRTYSAVLPGADVKVTFTVNVIAAGSDTLMLRSGLSKSSSHPNGYWELLSDDYDLGSEYNPNAQSTKFDWEVGTFEMALYGKVPASSSSVAKSINVVTLTSGSGGSAIDTITVQATSAGLAAFNTLYAQQAEKLDSLISSGVAAGYIEIYTNVLEAAQVIANNGDVEGAMDLLNGLNVSNEPVSSTMESLFLPIVAVLAVVAVVFVVLFMRVRSKVGYFQLVVEDQIKDLEGLTLRASKIDRRMSASLESIKDRLKHLVGT